MDNKKFVVIFTILLIIMFGLITYSVVTTIKASQNENRVTIDEFNDIILESSNFKNSRVSDITLDNVSEILGIESEDINKIYGKKSVLGTDASLYVLIEPKQGKIDSIYSKLDQFCQNYELEWQDYLESEYDIVKDRNLGKMDFK